MTWAEVLPCHDVLGTRRTTSRAHRVMLGHRPSQEHNGRVIVLCVISLRKVLEMHQNNYFLTLIRGGGMLVDIEFSMLQT
jgi:hypothetical protein